MKPKEILIIRVNAGYIATYDAADRDWRHIGRVEINGGRCRAWCYGTEDNEVYSRKVRGWWSFDNGIEERMHLRRIRRAMAKWWNKYEEGGERNGA